MDGQNVLPLPRENAMAETSSKTEYSPSFVHQASAAGSHGSMDTASGCETLWQPETSEA
jgi:hypothetical protein